MSKKILLIFGTRPEAIKMLPLYKELSLSKYHFNVKICVTAQHRQMLDQVMDFFKVKADYDLNIMKKGQSLFDVTSLALLGIEKVLEKFKPDLVLVQGDTTTAFVGALAAHYKKIKIGHVEAGLRSFNLFSPFPEEANRKMLSQIADFHFAPTAQAVKNLKKEGFNQNVFVVKNTVIDGLFWGLDIIKKNKSRDFKKEFSFLDPKKQTILVTAHRRESFGKPFENICNAIKEIVKKTPDTQVVFPVHFNPNVREPVNRILKGNKHIFLIEPLSYPKLIWLMSKSSIILTDSGGIQEEAPSLGKPVLVMRDVTERMEGVRAGTAKLVGTDKNKIVRESLKLLISRKAYKSMSKAKNPYGDGKTSQRIARILNSKVYLTAE